ncbi:MAG TPA: phosphatase PAP2 family protein [Candidatus Acidoferrum sp.]|nr:phosphatase PAP2 family protein [Candidatus Acidoferrum sp.]
MSSATYVRLAVSIAVAVSVFWLASRESIIYQALAPPFSAVVVFSLFFIMLRTAVSLREIAGAFAMTVALWAVDARFLGYQVGWGVYISILGLAGLILLTYRVIWREGERRRIAIYALGSALIFVGSEACTIPFLNWTSKAHPLVLDLYLYSFDASLRLQIPFLVGQFFEHSVGFMMVSFFVYWGLPIAIGMAFAGCLMSDRKSALPALVAMLIAGPLGVICYNLYPALGPVHLFADRFPWHPLTTEQARRLFLEPVALAGYRNAIPSLHATWMYLVCWYVRRLSVVERAGAAFFLFFTLCFTMGRGEHYFIDLIVALPFTVFVLALTNLLLGRGRGALVVPLLAGLGTTLGWLVALRFAIRTFWISPLIPWAACILTVVGSLWAGKKLLLLEREPEATAKTSFARVLAEGLRE